MSEGAHTQISKGFYSDMEKDGMLFAKIIRAHKKSGILKAIDTSQIPEGFFFVCANNFPGKNSIETLGQQTEIFCSSKILYEGQPIGILAGPDKKLLEEAAQKIKVEIENVPGGAERTVLSQKHIVIGGGRQKNVSSFFARAAFNVRNKWVYNLDSTEANETNGCLCYFVKDNLVLCTPTQWPRHLLKNLSQVFGIPEEKILVNKTVSSEPNTNSLWGNTLLCLQVCAAVMASKKPVQLVLSREENERYFSNTGEVSISHRTALNKDGLIQAAIIDIDFDAGAFNPFAEEIIDRLTIASVGIYNAPNLEITAVARSSAKPPATINIETIDAQAFFALECQLQKICDTTGLDPAEVRIKNSKILGGENAIPQQMEGGEEKKDAEVKEKDEPKKKAPAKMPFVIKVEKAYESLNAILLQSDFKRKFVSYRINSLSSDGAQGGYMAHSIKPRGMGLSTAYDASGYYGTSIFECNQKMEATLEKDGSLTIHAITPSKTILEIWKNEAAEILQIEPKMVKVNSEFNLRDEPLIPENFYSNLSIMTSLLKKCCQGIQAKRFRSPLPITVSRAITKTQINQWNKARFKGTPFNSTSFIVVALELKIDTTVFKPEIKNIWVAVSAGKILAGKEAENKIKFSIQKTLAELIENERIFARHINISFVQSESEPAQIGGLIKKALPAAFASALSQALGNSVTSVPLKGDTLFTLAFSNEAEAKDGQGKKEGGQ